MTEATQTRPSAQLRTEVEIHYHVAMPQPESHLFEVRLEVKGWRSPVLDLKMPVWTPGSYLVREYAKHLQDFTAEAETPLRWRKISKNHWQIETGGASDLTVGYRIFANELSVRTNHLTATHGYFNGAALFFFIPGYQAVPVQVTIHPPQPTWKIATSLPPVPGQDRTFEAANFDTLVDSPFEVGIHQRYEFKVLGKAHELVIWGKGNANAAQIIADTQKIIQVEADLFGGLPYDRYLFLLHLSSQGFGGLEHKDSCSLNYPRLGFRLQDKYRRFMQLVAHEFFHLWNIKRIRPKELEVFNYEVESFTTSLWFSEGTTSYYDLNIPFRAGIYDAHWFIKSLGQEISRYLNIPGRRIQPLGESSFDAWIKLYRKDANSDNSQISYYLKGEMVSLLLDLLIRSRHQHQRSLDDVMRLMWNQFGKDETGFTAEQLQQAIESVAETDLSAFFDRCLYSVQELPFEDYLTPFGLEIQSADQIDDLPPFLGMTVKAESGKELIKFVETNSPAQKAGIDAGDELLALDGLRITAEQLSDRLQDYQPGDTIELAVFHQDELLTTSVVLGQPRSNRYYLAAVENPSQAQQDHFKAWLGISLSEISS